jgi:hypothetical protein
MSNLDILRRFYTIRAHRALRNPCWISRRKYRKRRSHFSLHVTGTYNSLLSLCQRILEPERPDNRISLTVVGAKVRVETRLAMIA